MGRSQETFGKKEVRKKKDKKRKEKEQKRAIRKSEGKRKNFDDMIAYVDEFGMITSTPPDPDRKTTVEAESIELTITRNNPQSSPDFLHKGVVSTFNKSKGYGFIRDLNSGQSVFVHVNSLMESVGENDTVVFELGKGVRGPAAMKVRLFREENG
jgi:cold shock CspA family protein